MTPTYHQLTIQSYTQFNLLQPKCWQYVSCIPVRSLTLLVAIEYLEAYHDLLKQYNCS